MRYACVRLVLIVCEHLLRQVLTQCVNTTFSEVLTTNLSWRRGVDVLMLTHQHWEAIPHHLPPHIYMFLHDIIFHLFMCFPPCFLRSRGGAVTRIYESSQRRGAPHVQIRGFLRCPSFISRDIQLACVSAVMLVSRAG